MKFILILLALSIGASLRAGEILVKQVKEVFYVSDGVNCLAWDKAWTPLDTIAGNEWQTVESARTKHNWPTPTTEHKTQCLPQWAVKFNTRSKDGSRPVKDIQTGKYTGQRVSAGSPCGARASTIYKEYYRVVPGGMAVCAK